MNKNALVKKIKTITNYVLTIIAFIGSLIVVILVETGNTISHFRADGIYFFFPGLGLTILFELVANAIYYKSKYKYKFIIEIILRIISLIAFVCFMFGAIMYTNGDGNISSLV